MRVAFRSPTPLTGHTVLLGWLLLLLSVMWGPSLPHTHALVVTDTDVVDETGGCDGVGPSDHAAAAPLHMFVFLSAHSTASKDAAELGGLVWAMEKKREVSLPYCQRAYMGRIRHVNGTAMCSLVVSTGINYINSALCTRDVLNLRRQHHYIYDAMVLVGTSSMSPMVGGWDPTNTTFYKHFAREEQRASEMGDLDAAADTAPPAPLFKSQKEVDEEQKGEARRREATLRDGKQPFSVPIASQLNFEYARTGAQVDWDGCSPRLPEKITPLSLGSVCVTSASFFHESGSCTERPRHNQCSRPHCIGFERGLGTERKIFVAHDVLAREMEAASYGKAWPTMPEAVRTGQQRLWRANEAVEPVRDGERPHRPAPLTPTFVKCAEATGNTIMYGGERDYLCREQTAYVLNVGRRQRLAQPHRDVDPPEPLVTSQNVGCVRAMEGVGFLRAIADDRTAGDIPVAVVRAAAVYDMHPMKKVTVPTVAWRSALMADTLKVSPQVAAAAAAAAAVGAQNSTTDEGTSTQYDNDTLVAYTWHPNPHVLSEKEDRVFEAASRAYAVETATFVISNYFFGGREFPRNGV